MIGWILAAWLFLAAFFWLFVAAANGARSMWLHVHWPPHRQRMRRAGLCLEAAEHFGGLVATTWISQAYRLCNECGCSVEFWPVKVRHYFEALPHA